MESNPYFRALFPPCNLGSNITIYCWIDCTITTSCDISKLNGVVEINGYRKVGKQTDTKYRFKIVANFSNGVLHGKHTEYVYDNDNDHEMFCVTQRLYEHNNVVVDLRISHGLLELTFNRHMYQW
jgi:hypothetical protein